MTNHVSGLARNTSLMALGTALSRLTGLGRLLALVYALGVTRFTDTYNLANNVPNIIFELVVGGILSATLIPVFVHEFTTKDEHEGWKAVSAIATTVMALLTGLSLLVFLAAPLIIHLYTLGNTSDTLNDQREVATLLLRLFVPQILFYGLISLATGLLQTKRVFGPPMFAPIFNNLVVIAVFLAFPHISTDYAQAVGLIHDGGPDTTLAAMANNSTGLFFLGLGTTLGVAAMGALLIPYVRRLGKNNIRFYWDPKHPAVIRMLKLSGWTIGFVVANQVALWVIFMLANHQAGAVTAFTTAYTFFILPHGIFTVSLISAIQPDLAEQWARGEGHVFRSRMAHGIKVIAAVTTPIGLAYAFLAAPIVTIILDHGQMTAGSAEQISEMLAWMAIGLPGFSIFIYLTRVFQSMHDGKTVFWLYAIQNGLCVLIALALFGPVGSSAIAISQTVSYCAAALVALLVLRKRLGLIEGKSLAVVTSKSLLASIASVAGLATIRQIIPDFPLVEVVLGILCASVIFILIARVLRLSELNVVLPRQLRIPVVENKD